jgi:predicted Zn-ribbon and HTH transcriptional regulator
MARVPITVMGFQCERCTHEWIPTSEKEPAVCPKCKSPYWNRPRKPTSMMTYEAFRDAIVRTLAEAPGPLTWTEIRTIAKLPQKFPNNRWVHDIEKDSGLKRSKDVHGIIKWQLS